MYSKSYKRGNNLYLNRDLTKHQQNLSFLIRTEFKNRKSNGENVSLKYLNGVPKIVLNEEAKNV